MSKKTKKPKTVKKTQKVKKKTAKKPAKKKAIKKTPPKVAKKVKTSKAPSTLPDLMPKNGKRGGRKSKLETILRHNPEGYAKMIGFIQMGCYMHVVAAAMGVDYATFANWLRSGKIDSAEEKDTIYSRFFADVYKAVATARMSMELKLLTIVDVKNDAGLLRHWLATGPGRLLGQEWQEKHTIEVTLDSPPEIVAGEEEFLDLNSAPVSTETMAGALTALEDLGLLQRTERSGNMFLEQDSKTGKVKQ